MARVTTLIKDVSPSTPRPWTARVTVVEKSHPLDARASPTKFQRMILADSENNRVQLTLFGEAIEMFKNRLQLFNSYYISNAAVKAAPLMYRVGLVPFQWTLHSTSLVEEAEVNTGLLGCLTYNFTPPLTSLPIYKDTSTPIDMLLIALKMLPQRQIPSQTGTTTLRELIVTDRSLQPVVLTFWDHFVTNEASSIVSVIEELPVVAALRVRVEPYDGLALSSKSSSSFLVNPPTEAVVALRAWVFDNMGAVTALRGSADLLLNAQAFGRQAANEYTPLSSIRSLPSIKLFNVRCHLRINDFNQRLLRKYCNYCKKGTTAELNATYTCNCCGRSDAVCLAGLRIVVAAFDASGELEVTLYENDVSNLFKCDGEALLADQLLPNPRPFTAFVSSDEGAEHTLQIRGYNHVYRGCMTQRYAAKFIHPPAPSSVDTPSSSSASTLSEFTLQEALSEGDGLELTAQEREIVGSILRRKEMKAKKKIEFAGSALGSQAAALVVQPPTLPFVNPPLSALHSAGQQQEMQRPMADTPTVAVSSVQDSISVGLIPGALGQSNTVSPCLVAVKIEPPEETPSPTSPEAVIQETENKRQADVVVDNEPPSKTQRMLFPDLI